MSQSRWSEIVLTYTNYIFALACLDILSEDQSINLDHAMWDYTYEKYILKKT